MIDIIITLAVSFLLSFVLLKRHYPPLIAFFIVASMAYLIGWQMPNFLQSGQTAVGWMLNVNPSALSWIWSQSQDAGIVFEYARFTYYISILFHLLAATLAFIIAYLMKKKT